MSVDEWIEQQPGKQIYLTAEKLGLTPAAFHEAMDVIDASEGGVGYHLVETKRESQTGFPRIVMVVVRKVI